MCTTKAPKPQPASTQEKKPQYLTNLWLDSPYYRQAALGRNSLRIDPGTPVNQRPPEQPPTTPPPLLPDYSGGAGLGIATGGGGSIRNPYIHTMLR